MMRGILYLSQRDLEEAAICKNFGLMRKSGFERSDTHVACFNVFFADLDDGDATLDCLKIVSRRVR